MRVEDEVGLARGSKSRGGRIRRSSIAARPEFTLNRFIVVRDFDFAVAHVQRKVRVRR